MTSLINNKKKKTKINTSVRILYHGFLGGKIQILLCRQNDLWRGLTYKLNFVSIKCLYEMK